MLLLLYLLFCCFLPSDSTFLEYTEDAFTGVTKRALQKSHEKPRIRKLSEFFLEKDFYQEDPDVSLINLLNEIAHHYLSDCTTVILYDNFTEFNDRVFLQKFFKQYPLTYVHGSIPDDFHFQIEELVNQKDKKCVHFLIFLKDVMTCQDIVNKRSEKVVVVAKSSQWRVQEYLYSEYSQEIANLLIIVKSDKFLQHKQEAPYILYTHKLFVDALGSSQPVVITSWSEGKFSRNVSLFQTKLNHGFSGHRFIIATAHQPPFVIKTRKNERDELEYTGIEIKLINLLSQMYNFSSDYKESGEARTLGAGESVVKTIKGGSVNLGIGGLYITESRYKSGIMHWHSEDCASFISLASTALPRYRAIMGPFQWTVWLVLIMVYMASILLFAYSDKLTLKHLIKNPLEVENMFWYVFGTFTNCFTFTGKKSWTKAERGVTKILVGIYWLFTIIITACYTGSIIAFVTLPIFPAVIDTIDQLLSKRYQVGMLDKDGWPTWFANVTDQTSQKLLRKVDFVSDVESGLRNVTQAFFWSYAYLGSREELNYIVRTNFSVGSKKSLLHISQQCFVPFKVGIILPPHSVYSEVIADGIQRIVQSGLSLKMSNDVQWEMLRTATGRLLTTNTKTGSLSALSREDRALSLDDTQGMFLLLAMGFIAGGSILLSEIFGGCFSLCKKSSYSRAESATSSISSNPRFHERQTNRERTHSVCLANYQRKPISKDFSTKRCSNEEAFGENVVEVELHTTPNMPEEKEEIDYNEEINKLFSEAFDQAEICSSSSEDDKEKFT